MPRKKSKRKISARKRKSVRQNVVPKKHKRKPTKKPAAKKRVVKRKKPAAKKRIVKRKKPATKKRVVKRKKQTRKPSLKSAGSKVKFVRKVSLLGRKRKSEEIVYDIPYDLVRQKIGNKIESTFVPSRPAIVAAFEHEISTLKHRKKGKPKYSSAVAKINVIFKQDESSPEDDDTWVTIPVGYRLPFDEPESIDKIYNGIGVFAGSYNVFAILAIELSFLREEPK